MHPVPPASSTTSPAPDLAASLERVPPWQNPRETVRLRGAPSAPHENERPSGARTAPPPPHAAKNLQAVGSWRSRLVPFSMSSVRGPGDDDVGALVGAERVLVLIEAKRFVPLDYHLGSFLRPLILPCGKRFEAGIIYVIQ